MGDKNHDQVQGYLQACRSGDRSLMERTHLAMQATMTACPHQRPINVPWFVDGPVARIGDVVIYCADCSKILKVTPPIPALQHPTRGDMTRIVVILKLWLSGEEDAARLQTLAFLKECHKCTPSSSSGSGPPSSGSPSGTSSGGGANVCGG
jgi:hypothetical protein